MKAKSIAAPAPAIPAALKPALDEWRSLVEWIEKAKPREMELRRTLAEVFFPNPVEGVNRIITEDGFEFTLEHKINRTIDEAALAPVMAELPESSPFRNPGVLITWKPVLVLGGLRVMPDEERKIFSQAMTEKPGTPSLEVEIKAAPIEFEIGQPNAGHSHDATINTHADFPASVSAAPATPIMDAYQTAKGENRQAAQDIGSQMYDPKRAAKAAKKSPAKKTTKKKAKK